MSPVYDANSVERGARAYQRMLSRIRRRADPYEYLNRRLFAYVLCFQCHVDVFAKTG